MKIKTMLLYPSRLGAGSRILYIDIPIEGRRVKMRFIINSMLVDSHTSQRESRKKKLAHATKSQIASTVALFED